MTNRTNRFGAVPVDSGENYFYPKVSNPHVWLGFALMKKELEQAVFYWQKP